MSSDSHTACTDGQVPAALDYARANQRWKTRVRKLLPVLVVIAAAAVTWRPGGAAFRAGRRMYWQRQCATFQLTPTSVVCEQRNGNQPDPGRDGSLRYESSPPDSVGYRPPPRCWEHFGTPVAGPLANWCIAKSATAFLHRLRCGAIERIVIVAWHESRGDRPLDSAYLQVTQIQPGTWTTPAAPAGSAPAYLPECPALHSVRRRDFRLYAGQADPSDPSHFVLPYEIDGVRGTIDGYLREDGKVDFRVR